MIALESDGVDSAAVDQLTTYMVSTRHDVWAVLKICIGGSSETGHVLDISYLYSLTFNLVLEKKINKKRFNKHIHEQRRDHFQNIPENSRKLFNSMKS